MASRTKKINQDKKKTLTKRFQKNSSRHRQRSTSKAQAVPMH
jgi:hypothetical protein